MLTNKSGSTYPVILHGMCKNKSKFKPQLNVNNNKQTMWKLKNISFKNSAFFLSVRDMYIKKNPIRNFYPLKPSAYFTYHQI